MDAHARAEDVPCEVIPVIDLMGGLVVHARRGDRAHYRPICSRICASPRIEDVVAGLLELFPFSRLYVADVDALRGEAPQWTALEAVRSAAPQLSLWIDAAIRSNADLLEVARRGTPVLASEALSAGEAEQLLRHCPNAVLSLDYLGDRFLGESSLLQRLPHFAADLISMNLARVGSDLGPDLERLAALRQLAPGCRLYAAGGVRDAADLRRCRQAGAAGVLVASALHEGRIGRAELQGLV